MNKISNVIEFVKARKEAKGDEGFSLIELVVAVGILAILSVTGVVAYSQITTNARQTAVDSAVAEVFTAAVAYENDNDPTGTTAKTAVDDWNAAAGENAQITINAPTKATDDDGVTTLTISGGHAKGETASKSGKI